MVTMIDYELSDNISPINASDTLATGMITLFSAAWARQGWAQRRQHREQLWSQWRRHRSGGEEWAPWSSGYPFFPKMMRSLSAISWEKEEALKPFSCWSQPVSLSHFPCCLPHVAGVQPDAKKEEAAAEREKTMFWRICYICPTTCLRRRRVGRDESISSMWCKSIEMRQRKIEQERATTPTRKRNQAMSF